MLFKASPHAAQGFCPVDLREVAGKLFFPGYSVDGANLLSRVCNLNMCIFHHRLSTCIDCELYRNSYLLGHPNWSTSI